MLGRGSNLLVADGGFPGLAVLVGEAVDDIVIDGTTVTAGAGVYLPVLARRTVAQIFAQRARCPRRRWKVVQAIVWLAALLHDGG